MLRAVNHFYPSGEAGIAQHTRHLALGVGQAAYPRRALPANPLPVNCLRPEDCEVGQDAPPAAGADDRVVLPTHHVRVKGREIEHRHVGVESDNPIKVAEEAARGRVGHRLDGATLPSGVGAGARRRRRGAWEVGPQPRDALFGDEEVEVGCRQGRVTATKGNRRVVAPAGG